MNTVGGGGGFRDLLGRNGVKPLRNIRNLQAQGRGSHLTPRVDMYQPSNDRVEYQLFSQEYFSNADVHLYLGDIYIDEVTDLEFLLMENVLPIYGYNSYTYDAIARGTRQVEGSFAMNFTSGGNLQKILDHAGLIGRLARESQSKVELSKFREGGSGDPVYKLEDILRQYGINSFNELAEIKEDELWGRYDRKNPYQKSPVEPYFTTKKSFDIKIVYGPLHEVETIGKYNSSSGMREPNVTVDTINDVQIRAAYRSASISEGSAPIKEEYRFIARDFNGASLDE